MREARPAFGASFGRVRIRLPAGGDRLGGSDDALLDRPDDEPDVVPHERAEQAAREDQRHVAAAERHLVVAELGEDDEPAGQEGDHRAPAEPPHDVRQDAARHGAAGLAAELGREEGNLHQVQVVEQADPGDPRQEVEPAENEVPAFHAENFHRSPPLSTRGILAVTGGARAKKRARNAQRRSSMTLSTSISAAFATSTSRRAPPLRRTISTLPSARPFGPTVDAVGDPDQVGVLELHAGPLVAVVEQHLDARPRAARRRAARPPRRPRGRSASRSVTTTS